MSTLQKIFINKMGLQETHYSKFCEISQIRSFDKKDLLLREGGICSFIGFVEDGTVRSFLQKDGEEFNNDFYFTGSFVSAFRSFITQTPAYSTIQALSPSTIRCITYAQLQTLEQSSDTWLKFGKHIAEELFIRKCKRETSLLRESAQERYESLIKSYPEIEQLVPQYQIASYLRIKPESLSRIKSLTYINK